MRCPVCECMGYLETHPPGVFFFSVLLLGIHLFRGRVNLGTVGSHQLELTVFAQGHFSVSHKKHWPAEELFSCFIDSLTQCGSLFCVDCKLRDQNYLMHIFSFHFFSFFFSFLTIYLYIYIYILTV